MSVYKGAIAEQFIGQELMALQEPFREPQPFLLAVRHQGQRSGSGLSVATRGTHSANRSQSRHDGNTQKLAHLPQGIQLPGRRAVLDATALIYRFGAFDPALCR
jgi:hypothetical protein